ncbi:unnamed protein product [Phaeothamnion confervicola]
MMLAQRRVMVHSASPGYDSSNDDDYYFGGQSDHSSGSASEHESWEPSGPSVPSPPPEVFRQAAPAAEPMRGPVRKGKWTAEEEAFTNRIIQDFNNGLLPVVPGTTLRSYLSEKLHSDPMRITKKFAGASCIGKRVFQQCERSPANLALMRRSETELAEIEARFLRRLGHQKPRKAVSPRVRSSVRAVAATAATMATSIPPGRSQSPPTADDDDEDVSAGASALSAGRRGTGNGNFPPDRVRGSWRNNSAALPPSLPLSSNSAARAALAANEGCGECGDCAAGEECCRGVSSEMEEEDAKPRADSWSLGGGGSGRSASGRSASPRNTPFQSMYCSIGYGGGGAGTGDGGGVGGGGSGFGGGGGGGGGGGFGGGGGGGGKPRQGSFSQSIPELSAISDADAGGLLIDFFRSVHAKHEVLEADADADAVAGRGRGGDGYDYGYGGHDGGNGRYGRGGGGGRAGLHPLLACKGGSVSTPSFSAYLQQDDCYDGAPKARPPKRQKSLECIASHTGIGDH